MKKIHYNSPVILTYFFLSLVVLIVSILTKGRSDSLLFSVYRSPISPAFFVRLFGHVLGHSGWEHFLGNMLLLLVVGPPMEEKYGSKTLLIGILLTAVISGLLQCLLFPHYSLLGASGVVFMLIMLSSLSGMKDGTIPVTLILVAILYLGREIYSALFVQDNVANFMHLVGGTCGTTFGMVAGNRSHSE